MSRPEPKHTFPGHCRPGAHNGFFTVKRSQSHFSPFIMNRPNCGFTLMELVMTILLLGIISVVAVAKWPTGLDEEAAVREMKQAIRYTQHMAFTRQFNGAATTWGLTLNNNAYTITRRGGSAQAADEFVNRRLLGNNQITLTGPAELLFNGMGEPITSSGAPLSAAVTYTIAGSRYLSVCPETGYALEGSTCP